MATHDPFDAQGHVEIPSQQSQRLAVQAAPKPVPREVELWLGQQGWAISSANGVAYFRHPDKWDGLYFEWWEAVTLENLSVISLGNVGVRKTNIGSGEDAAMAAPVG